MPIPVHKMNHLHLYSSSEENVNIYNIPHKYRFAKKTKQFFVLDPYLSIWENEKSNVIKELVSKIKNDYKKEDIFYYCIPATDLENRRLFLEPILLEIQKVFINAINLSDYLTKESGTSLGETNKNITIENKKKLVEIDKNIVHAINKSVKSLVIVDDVFGIGTSISVTIEKITSIITNIEKIDCYIILKVDHKN